MNLKKSTADKGIYVAIIVVFFYVIILFYSDINKIILVLNQIQFERYIAILSLTVLTLLLQGWKYKILLSKLDINLNFKDSFLIHTAGLAMLITPGSSGLILSNLILKKRTGRSISSTMPSFIYEAWLDIVVLTTIIGILLYWSNSIASQIVFVIGFILVGFIFFVFKNSIGLDLLNKILLKTRILKKFIINADEFEESTKKLTSSKTTLQLLFISTLTKLIPMIAVYFVFELFSLNLDFFNTSQIFLTSQIIGILSFVPGGVIITETGLLGLIMKEGVEFSVATMLVLLLRIMTFWFPIFLGFIALKFVLKMK